MVRRSVVGVVVLALFVLLATPAFAQPAGHTTAITSLSSRLKNMQAELGSGKLFNWFDPTITAPAYDQLVDSTYTYSGFAALGFTETFRRMGTSAPAGMLAAAGAAFDGAVVANGTGGLTYGDILTGLDLGHLGSGAYATQGGQAVTALKAIVTATTFTTASTIAGKIIADNKTANGGSDSGGAWLSGLAARAFAQVGTAEVGTGVTGMAVATEIASQLDTTYKGTGTAVSTFAAETDPFYILGWSGIAMALAATGTDPEAGTAAYLTFLKSTQAADGFLDETEAGFTGKTDVFQGTAYGIMALRAAIDAGFNSYTDFTNMIGKAGSALATQVNDTIGYTGPYTGYTYVDGFAYASVTGTNAGFFEYGSTTTTSTGYVEFGQFDGEGLYGIAASTPEPGTLALFGLGLLTVGAVARRRRRVRA